MYDAEMAEMRATENWNKLTDLMRASQHMGEKTPSGNGSPIEVSVTPEFLAYVWHRIRSSSSWYGTWCVAGLEIHYYSGRRILLQTAEYHQKQLSEQAQRISDLEKRLADLEAK